MKNKNEKQVEDGFGGKESKGGESKSQNVVAKKNSKPQLIELSPELDKEVCGILDHRISKMTGEKLNPIYKERLYKAVVVLNDFVSKYDHLCPRTSLKNFKRKHVLAFQDHLTQTEVSPFSEKKIHKNSLFAIEIRLKNVFQQGKGRGVIEENIFNTIDIPTIINVKSPERGYVSESEIERLTWIDTEKLKKMDIEEKYYYLLPRVMIRGCYETAGRACEIVKLCVEDILIPQIRKDGLMPETIIGGKQRPPGHVDTVWILYERMKFHLDIWLPVLHKFYDYVGIDQAQIEIPKRGKQKGTPLFPYYDKKSKKFSLYKSGGNYRTMFHNFFKNSDILEYFWTRTHFLRGSRITEWLNQLWDFRGVSQNARHKTLGQTKKYDKGIGNDRADRIAKKIGLSDTPSLDFEFPQPNIFDNIVYQVIRILEKKDYTKTLPVLNRIFLSQIRNEVIRNINSVTNIGEYYSIEEMADKWEISKSQAHIRLKELAKCGRIQLKEL